MPNTPALGLPYPAPSAAPNVPADLSALAAAVDALLGTPWTPYTPTWTSTGTQPTIGNGERVGAYKRIGKTVFFRAKIYTNTTTLYGTGDYSVSLPPFNVAEEQAAVAIFRDNSSAVEYPMVAWLNSGQQALHIVYGAGLKASNTAPVAWAATDRLEITGVYESL